MNEHLEKVKSHLKRNKTVYISTGAGILAGAAGMYYYRGATVAKASQQINGLVNVKPTQNLLQITILERRGHPGYKIVCNETGETAASINRMAQLHGIDRTMLSKHLRFPDKHPNINGVTYSNLGEM